MAKKKAVEPAAPRQTKHAQRLEAAREAVNRIYADTSVPQAMTRSSLEDVAKYCDSLMESLLGHPEDEHCEDE